MKFAIYCLDENSIPNINPTQFSVIVKSDKAPNIIINDPPNESEIYESFTLPIKLSYLFKRIFKFSIKSIKLSLSFFSYFISIILLH